MTVRKCLCRNVVVFFTLASSVGALAESTRVFELKPVRGYARPPLHVNITPLAATSYTPAQIRHAYGFDQLGVDGTGQKIAIVDAFGNPDMQSNLDQFCTTFGLPKTTIQVIGNTGSNTGWALETALDVEWAHAIAPGASIILSVAKSTSLTDLLAAVDAAVSAGATVVSMSWGTGEFSGESTYDSHFNKNGVTFTASSGDNGAGVEWPAVSRYVVGVGGTSLNLNADGSRSSETAWSGSGGGSSAYVARPSFQTGWHQSTGRGVPDVSFVADPNTGVQVYDAYNGGWWVVGGTSASAPQWAGLIALANQNRSATLTSAAVALYLLGQGPVNQTGPYAGLFSVNPVYFYDVSQGSNGGYDAGPPYDFVTGLGSPLANALVPALTGARPDFSLSVNPSSQPVAAGAVSTNYTVTVTPTNGFTGTVTLNSSGLPAGSTYSFNPASVAGSGSSILSVTTPGGTVAGVYPFTITGTSGSLGHTASATLVVGPPAAPTPISPVGSGISPTSAFTFTTVAGATGYQVWLWDGTTWLISSWYTPAQVDPSNTGTGTITLPTPLANGIYYWTLTARNAVGVGPAVAGLSFSVGAPPAPTPIAPVGSGITTRPTYTFTTVGGATGYQIWLWDGTTWTISSVYTAAQVDPSNTGTGTITLPTPLANGTYYWTLTARNAVGVGPAMTGLYFSVGAPPPAPTPISPVGSGISTTPVYTFTTVAGATGYQIWLYNGTTWVTSSWYTPAQVDPSSSGTGRITQPTPLANGIYYWTLWAHNGAGNGPAPTGLSFSIP